MFKNFEYSFHPTYGVETQVKAESQQYENQMRKIYYNLRKDENQNQVNRVWDAFNKYVGAKKQIEPGIQI